MNSARLLAAVLVLTPLLPVSQAGATLAKDIRDWSVTCTTGLTCIMSFADWDSKSLRSLRFRRTDAPNADVELMVSAPPGFDANGDPKGFFAFKVDGKAVLSLPVSALRKEGYDVHLVYSGQKSIRTLLDAMKAGGGMEIVYRGDLGTFNLSVKLSGVKGSLVYVDEAQDRLRRTDALEVTGDKAPPAHTLARDIVTLSELPESIRGDFTGDEGDCSGLDDDIKSYNGFDLMLGDTRMLVVPCGEGGAYNQPYALYMSRGKELKQISFPDVGEDGKRSMDETAYNLDFDPKARTFTSFFRGRGIGDCGLWSKWKLADKGMPGLVLLEARRKDDCDGRDMGGPQNFPLTFSAAQ